MGEKNSDPVIEVRAKLKGRVKTDYATVSGELRGGQLNLGSRQVEFDGAHVVDVDLNGKTFESFRVRESIFERCDFRRFRSTTTLPAFGIQAPKQTLYRECRFDGADLRRASVGEARFESCVFDGAKIERLSSTHAEFIDCHFAGKVVSSNFCGRAPEVSTYLRRTPGRERRNEFRGNDFSKTDLIDTAFKFGIDISAQRWPQAPEYIRLDRLPERFAQARKAIEALTSEADRKAGLEMLYLYSHYGYEEQQELFTRRVNLPAIPRKIRDRVWDLLEHAL
jgi:uncharacterized protein YjbI with pentapeptide repeats